MSRERVYSGHSLGKGKEMQMGNYGFAGVSACSKGLGE